MSENLNVSMEVTDEGSIEKIDSAGTSFEKTAESADEASESISRFEEVVSNLEAEATSLRGAIAEANSDIDDISKRLGGIQAVASRTEASFAQLAAELPIRAEKDEFIDSLNNINDGLQDGEISADQLNSSLESLEQQYSSTSESQQKQTKTSKESEQQSRKTSQQAEKEVVALEKLEEGHKATAQEIEDTIRANNLLEESVASASNRLNKVDQVIGEFGISFTEVSDKLDFTVQGVNEFNKQLDS